MKKFIESVVRVPTTKRNLKLAAEVREQTTKIVEKVVAEHEAKNAINVETSSKGEKL